MSRPNQQLTKREKDVADLISRGQSNKLAAYELGVSYSGIKQALHRSFRKLKVSNRTELAFLVLTGRVRD